MVKRSFESIRFFFLLHGFTGGLSFLFNLIRANIDLIYVFDLSEFDPVKIKTNPTLSIKFIDTAQEFNNIFPLYSKILGPTQALKEKESIDRNVSTLVAVFERNLFVGWGWVMQGPLVYGNSALTSKDILIHKCRTLREHRKKGIYSTLLASILSHYSHKGFNHAFIGAKSFNVGSINGIQKAGFKFIESDKKSFPFFKSNQNRK